VLHRVVHARRSEAVAVGRMAFGHRASRASHRACSLGPSGDYPLRVSGTPQKSQGPLPWGGGEQNQHVQPVGSWRWWAFGQRQNSPRPQLGQWPHGTPSASSGGEESEMRPVPLLPKLTQLGFGGFVSSSPMPFSARASLRRSRYLPIQRALGLIRYRVVGRPPSGIFPLSPAAIQSRSLSRLRPATT